VTPAEASAELDRMAVLAAVQGELLGAAPVLWLLREALERYVERWREHAERRVNFPARAPRKPPGPAEIDWLWLIYPQFQLAWFPLFPVFVLEDWSWYSTDDMLSGTGPKRLDVPNGALALYDRVKSDPVLALDVLQRIAAATPERWASDNATS